MSEQPRITPTPPNSPQADAAGHVNQNAARASTAAAAFGKARKLVRLAAFSGVKRESRYGIVIVLSFTLILSGMIWKKWKGPASSGAVVNEIPNASDKSKNDKPVVAASDPGTTKDQGKAGEPKGPEAPAGADGKAKPPAPASAEKLAEVKPGDTPPQPSVAPPNTSEKSSEKPGASTEARVADAVPPAVPPAADAGGSLTELPPLGAGNDTGQKIVDTSKDSPPRPNEGANGAELAANPESRPTASPPTTTAASNEPIITPLPGAALTPPAAASSAQLVNQQDSIPSSPPGEIGATNLPAVDSPSGGGAAAPLPPIADVLPATTPAAKADPLKQENGSAQGGNKITSSADPGAASPALGTESLPGPAERPGASDSGALTEVLPSVSASTLPAVGSESGRRAAVAVAGGASAALAADAVTTTPKPSTTRPAPATAPMSEEGWVALPTISRKPESSTAVASVTSPIDPPPRRVESVEPVGAGVVTPVAHVVQRNENFFTISRRYYGTGRYYMALWSANRQKVSAVDQLYVGTTIIIPPEESLDRSLVQPPKRSQLGRTSSAPKGRNNTSARSRDRSEVPVDLPLTADAAGSSGSREDDVVSMRNARQIRADLPYHRVRPNETLRSIARSRLDDSHRAKEIEELNEDVIRYDNAGNLIPNQMLRLPQDARPLRSE